MAFSFLEGGYTGEDIFLSQHVNSRDGHMAARHGGSPCLPGSGRVPSLCRYFPSHFPWYLEGSPGAYPMFKRGSGNYASLPLFSTALLSYN